LRWKNVTDGRIEFQQKKTGKFEYLPLSAVAKEILGPQGNREEPVFQVPFDHQIARDLRRWCQAAGIEKAVTFHTSRHTYATVMLTRGADLPAIQNLLGHRSIRTTQIYAQIIDSKKRDTVDLFPSIKL
jgi:integrase